MEVDNKKIQFNHASLDILQEVVNISTEINFQKFDEWFNYKYEILDEDDKYLNELIELNQLFLQSYNEQKLITKFIAPLLNKVNFYFNDIQDWYGYNISGKINGYTLTGEADYMVAKGFKKPKIPYFFIQEFKSSYQRTDPENQLIAELLIAMKINNNNHIKGAYVAGKFWHFIILEKDKNENYKYYVSKSYDCLDIEDLRKMYAYFQAIKHKYCK